MSNKDELIQKVKSFDGKTLLSAYEFCAKNFNPIDEDNAETYRIVESEMIRRLNIGRERENNG